MRDSYTYNSHYFALFLFVNTASAKYHCSTVGCFKFGHWKCLGFVQTKLAAKQHLFFCEECVNAVNKAPDGMFIICLSVILYCIVLYIIITVCLLLFF